MPVGWRAPDKLIQTQTKTFIERSMELISFNNNVKKNLSAIFNCAERSRKEGWGWGVPWYKPRQICDTFSEPLLFKSDLVSHAVYEKHRGNMLRSLTLGHQNKPLLHTSTPPWRFTVGFREA